MLLCDSGGGIDDAEGEAMNMKKSVLLVALGFVFCLVCSWAWGQGEFPLKYRDVQPGSSALVSMARVEVPRHRTKPAGLKVLPQGLSRSPSYFVAPIGGKGVALVLDYYGTARLYVDTNLDGDLSDEKRLTAQMSRGMWRFGPVTKNS